MRAFPLPSYRLSINTRWPFRRAQGERKDLSECRPSTAQAEPVEAGFAHWSTVSRREGGQGVRFVSPKEPGATACEGSTD